MSDASAPTRAEDGRETGQIAYEAWVEGEGLNLIAVSNLPIMPWRSLSDEAKAIWEAIERKSAAQAEAEVARLELCNQQMGYRVEAAEAITEVLTARVATLEAALQPFVEHARRYADWLRRGIAPNPNDEHFEAARTALEAPHDDK